MGRQREGLDKLKLRAGGVTVRAAATSFEASAGGCAVLQALLSWRPPRPLQQVRNLRLRGGKVFHKCYPKTIPYCRPTLFTLHGAFMFVILGNSGHWSARCKIRRYQIVLYI